MRALGEDEMALKVGVKRLRIVHGGVDGCGDSCGRGAATGGERWSPLLQPLCKRGHIVVERSN